MTLHFSDRQWAGGSPQRARRGFSTRNQGHQLSRKIWICIQCERWHEPQYDPDLEVKTKPSRCLGGGAGKPCLSNKFRYFDSSKEAQHFMQLLSLARTGRVRNLQQHPRFDLVTVTPDRVMVVIGQYVADAAYEWRENDDTWSYRVDDVKPRSELALDPVFKWKRRHFEAQTGHKINLIT